jgi:hypothetical protein
MNDPINPAHYNGTACAQIGERLTGNSYQVLKYNWRLGRKNDPLIEMGKSIWYLDREILLAHSGFRCTLDIPPDSFFHPLLTGADVFAFNVAIRLIDWCRYNDIHVLIALRDLLIHRRAQLETEMSGQNTMEI